MGLHGGPSHLFRLFRLHLSKVPISRIPSLSTPLAHDKIPGVEAFVNRLKLFYTDAGKTTAPAVVFIHGFPFDHTMWQEQVAILEDTFRVITYDQRGHGQSPTGDGQYIFEQFVDDLIGLLDILGIQQAILCGLSMGGYVALRAMEREPSRFRGLVLCDTRSEADSNEGKLKRAASIRTITEKGTVTFVDGFLKSIFTPESFTAKPQAVAQIRQVMLSNTAKGICGTQIALATRTDTTALLANIKVPTLILVGKEDPITPPEAARSMHERIQGSILVEIPGASHLSNIENPALFNESLKRFLNTLNP